MNAFRRLMVLNGMVNQNYNMNAFKTVMVLNRGGNNSVRMGWNGHKLH